MRRLIATLVATLAVWLCGSSMAVATIPSVPIVTHCYDNHAHPAPSTYTTGERGPPACGHPEATYDATGRSLCGSSARPSIATAGGATAHASVARVAQDASATRTTQTAPGADVGQFLSFQPVGVAANSGNRVFWSGGQSAKEAAEAFAKASGSKTLEMTAMGRTLERLPYNRFTAKLWDAASAGFAATARGDANVFIGPTFRGAGSTFGRIEGPILRFKGNPILQRFEDVW